MLAFIILYGVLAAVGLSVTELLFLVGPARCFILNTEANVEVDFTALQAVGTVRAELSRRGIEFGLARVKQDLLDDLQTVGLAQKIGKHRIFPTLPTAVAAHQEWARQHPRPGQNIAG